jgi:hypothetical protein
MSEWGGGERRPWAALWDASWGSLINRNWGRNPSWQLTRQAGENNEDGCFHREYILECWMERRSGNDVPQAGGSQDMLSTLGGCKTVRPLHAQHASAVAAWVWMAPPQASGTVVSRPRAQEAGRPRRHGIQRGTLHLAPTQRLRAL